MRAAYQEGATRLTSAPVKLADLPAGTINHHWTKSLIASADRPSGTPRDVLTGFVLENGDAMGRPVGVAIAQDGSLLVADDVGNAVWRVSRAPTTTR